jgi:hypothetical protein
VLVFLTPTLAVDHKFPNASPLDAGFAAAGLIDEAPEAPDAGFAWVTGAWTEVK